MYLFTRNYFCIYSVIVLAVSLSDPHSTVYLIICSATVAAFTSFDAFRRCELVDAFEKTMTKMNSPVPLPRRKFDVWRSDLTAAIRITRAPKGLCRRCACGAIS